jgi:hypothetical protein
MMSNNRLQIRRVHAKYVVSAQHPSPALLKDQLDSELRKNLPQVLSSAFSTWFSANDPSIWFVRRLQIEVAASSGEELSRTFSTQLGRTLSQTLSDGGEPNTVVHFSDRVSYLARFLHDLARGYAWSCWYYESFEGLRMLPTSAALRTTICDQSEPGGEALLNLSSNDLLDVLRALNRHDAGLIFDHLASTSEAGDEADCCKIAWAGWQAITPGSLDGFDESQLALLLYLTSSRDQPALGLNLKRATQAMLCLADRLCSRSAAENEQLLSALTGNSLAGLYKAAASDAETLLPFLRCSPEWLSEVADVIGEQSAQKADYSGQNQRHTSFGAAFLLLPFIDELPLEKATRDWPHLSEAAAISLVRFLLLVKCCGAQNARRSFEDPLLRDLLLIPPSVSVETICEWQSGVSNTDVQDFLQTLFEWQRTQEAVTGEKQILTEVLTEEQSVHVLIDGERGLWTMLQTSEPARLIAALRDPAFGLEHNDRVLFCDPTLLEMLWAEFPSVKMTSVVDAESEGDQISRILARLEKLPDDLEHLALPSSFQLSPELDLALSLVAQNLMRVFASTLTGFGLSSLPYLWSNFLNFSASLDEEPERRVVRLTRPPLHLVLARAGAMRQSYRLGWLDERPLMLFEETR